MNTTSSETICTFLGTGAAEGVPAAYCRCGACARARAVAGKEIKSRSSLRVGARHQIDLGPDYYLQMIRHGMDMHEVMHLLITHTHEDHFAPAAVTDRFMSADVPEGAVSLYLSRPGVKYLEQIIRSHGFPDREIAKIRETIRIVPLEYFRHYEIGDLAVETVRGNHTAWGEDEKSINYLIRNESGRSLLYAADTGYYEDESFEYLSDKRVDVLVLECTFAGRTDRGVRPSGHLDFDSYIEMVSRMAADGFIDEETRIFSTHLNPHQGLTHEALQRRFDETEYNVTVAYDGLELSL